MGCRKVKVLEIEPVGSILTSSSSRHQEHFEGNVTRENMLASSKQSPKGDLRERRQYGEFRIDFAQSRVPGSLPFPERKGKSTAAGASPAPAMLLTA